MIFKDTFYTLVPINCLLRCMGLSNVYRKGNQLIAAQTMFKSAVYIFIVTGLNLAFLYSKIMRMKNQSHNSSVRFTDILQLSYWVSYFIYIIDTYFVQKYGTYFLFKYLKTFDHIDSILGNICYDRIRRTIVSIVILTITLYIFTTFFDYICWVLVEGWKNPTTYIIEYFYFYLNILSILDVVCNIVQIKYRLKMMKVLLQKDNNVTSFINPAIQVNEYTNFNNNSKSLKSLHKCRTDDLETAWFTKCYLLLLDQVSYVNIYFGLRVMVHCANLQMNMMNVLNLALRSVNGNLIEPEGEVILSSSSVLSRFLTITSSILRIMNYEFIVIILMYQCEQAYRQSERILETIDMLMTSKRYNRDLKRNLLEFRNLLITRPIKFHAAKFFTMDYTLLVSLNSVVITYTIIMYQNMQ